MHRVGLSDRKDILAKEYEDDNSYKNLKTF